MIDAAALGRALIVAGLVLAGAGVLLVVTKGAGLFRLPGDVVYRRGSFTFFMPLATCLLLSVVLTLVLWLVGRWRR